MGNYQPTGSCGCAHSDQITSSSQVKLMRHRETHQTSTKQAEDIHKQNETKQRDTRNTHRVVVGAGYRAFYTYNKPY